MNFWQSWISVDDRLPDLDDSVLFYDEGHGRILIGELLEMENGCKAWVATNGRSHLACEEVTHWMRLPDEPSEQAFNVGAYIDATCED